MVWYDRLPLLSARPAVLPFQPKSIIALWSVPNYTAWWQRHSGISSLSSLPKATMPGLKPICESQVAITIITIIIDECRIRLPILYVCMLQLLISWQRAVTSRTLTSCYCASTSANITSQANNIVFIMDMNHLQPVSVKQAEWITSRFVQ